MSPDGGRIVFMSMRDDYCALYVMNADGTDQRNLTPREPANPDGRPGCSMMPDWGSDGLIYFSSSRPATGGDSELFVVAPDGSGLTRLTTVPGRDQGARPY
jgi:Tol biopolymer transport system component